MSHNVQLLVTSALAPEVPLARSPPLTLTRNFGWVVVFCLTTLSTVPLVVAWAASMLLH